MELLDWSSFNLVYSKKLRQVWIAGSVLDSQKDTHFFYFFTHFLGKFWFVSKPMSEKHSFIIKFLPEKCAGLCYVGIHNLVWLRPPPWGLDGLWAQPWQMYHTPSVMLNLKKKKKKKLKKHFATKNCSDLSLSNILQILDLQPWISKVFLIVARIFLFSQ